VAQERGKETVSAQPKPKQNGHNAKIGITPQVRHIQQKRNNIRLGFTSKEFKQARLESERPRLRK
jgi:hypothetical protein